MKFLRKHWYDLGALLSLVVFVHILIRFNHLTHYQVVMWSSLITLFLHQLEEYRIAGTFPGMINTVMYRSKKPDRYPLNANTALFVNVVVAWTLYFSAAYFAEKVVWLGIATILVSIGNTIAHTIIFNLRGKSVYNAGMLSCLVLFVPCTYLFFLVIHKEHLVTTTDYLLGIPLGIFINIVGVLKLIDWMADEHTSYIFDQRNLLPGDRVNRTY